MRSKTGLNSLVDKQNPLARQAMIDSRETPGHLESIADLILDNAPASQVMDIAMEQNWTDLQQGLVDTSRLCNCDACQHGDGH